MRKDGNLMSHLLVTSRLLFLVSTMPTWAGQSYQALQQQPRRKLQRQANPRRSSSFLGALKSIVSAPLTWFGSDEDFESEVGINGKRQRNASGGATQARQELQTTGRAQPEDVDDAPRAKRPRVEDPQPEPKRPYLDPPGLAFTNHLQYGPRGTAHGATGVNGISRTMPVDPRASAPPSPSPMREMSAASAEGEVANASGSTFARASTWMHSAPPAPGPISRDYSMPPVGGTPSTRPQAPFRMRSSFSLTPQPSGQGFGPRIHRERGHSEQPPPLADLMANPVFLQPPSEEPATHGLAPGGHRRSMSLQPTLTLGTIAEQRVRHLRSSLLTRLTKLSSVTVASPAAEYFYNRSLCVWIRAVRKQSVFFSFTPARDFSSSASRSCA